MHWYNMQKIEFNGLYRLNNTLISPYYGVGFGYVTGKDYDSTKEFGCLVLRPMVGVTVNLFNIMYIRSNIDYEFFSVGRDFLDLEYHHDQNYHLTYSFMFGAYLF